MGELGRQLAEHAVGSNPRRWGICSGSATWHLERALQRLVAELSGVRGREGDSMDALARRVEREAARLGEAMPAVRARVQLGEEALLVTTSDEVAAVAECVHQLDPIHDWVSQLYLQNGAAEFYLPAALRPRHVELLLIEARNRPVSLSVSADGESVRLSNIDVRQPLRCQGAASAALEDLCLFADAYDKSITAVFAPTVDSPGWVAAWYLKAGFYPRSGGEWKVGTEIIRKRRG